MKPFKVLKVKVHGYFPIIDLNDIKELDLEDEDEVTPVCLCYTKECAEMLAEWMNDVSDHMPLI